MTGRGSFFAVDRRAWAAVCDLGSINAAVAYLVLARGTLSDMRTTAWSVKAIETYTGVPRYLAKDAIAKLIGAGLIEQARGGTKPLYVLTHADPRAALSPITDAERHVLGVIEAAGQAIYVPKVGRRDAGWDGGNPYNIACGLVRKGYLTAYRGQVFGPVPESGAAPSLDWAWLPATIIDGAAGEIAPVELLRQSQHLPALRLFVDLYHAQSLPRHGGIHWRQARQLYEKRKYGQQGPYTVWGFIKGGLQAWPHPDFVAPHLDTADKANLAGPFWRALDLLRTAGLAAFVPHIIEADTAEAGILYPYAQGHGEPEEQAVASFGHEAGFAMLADWQQRQADDDGALLVPLLPHLAEAQMVGVLRLRYQAGTEANAGWLRDSQPGWSRAAEGFAKLAGKPFSISGLQHQLDINSTSTRDQLLG